MINKKSFFNIHTVKKPLLAAVVIIFIVVVFGAVGKAEGDTAWLLLANSNYFYASPTITLEVKYKPLLPDSQDTRNTNDSGDKANTVLSDDNEGQEEPEETGQDDNMAISSGDNDQHQGQHQEQQAGGDDNTGLLPHLGRNALIISRLTEKHSLRTEIEVDNITSQDAVFIDVFSFSGDVPSASTSGDWGDTQEDGSGRVDAADTVFISFENEDRVVKTVRIGIDAEQGGGIDKITILDGISERTSEPSEPVDTAPQDFQQDSHHSHYVDDSTFALEQIKSPIIVILPDTDERMYFIDGKALKEQVFSRDYGIEGIKAVRDEVEIRLIRK